MGEMHLWQAAAIAGIAVGEQQSSDKVTVRSEIAVRLDDE